jgi:S-adenosylmethionine:diacylglycerol 3-amino-3-carboxypropyl transferase
MAALTIQQVESDVIGIAVSVLNANKAAIVADINAGETAITATIVTALKSLPAVKGVVGLVAGPIEATLESDLTAYVAKLVATYGGEQVFDLLIALLTKL